MVEYGNNICLICRSIRTSRTPAVSMSNLPQLITRTKPNKEIPDNERRKIIQRLFANNRVAYTRKEFSDKNRKAASSSDVKQPPYGSSYEALKAGIKELQSSTQRSTQRSRR